MNGTNALNWMKAVGILIGAVLIFYAYTQIVAFWKKAASAVPDALGGIADSVSNKFTEAKNAVSSAAGSAGSTLVRYQPLNILTRIGTQSEESFGSWLYRVTHEDPMQELLSNSAVENPVYTTFSDARYDAQNEADKQAEIIARENPTFGRY